MGVAIGFVSLMFIQPNLLKAEELGLTRILIAAASLLATILPLGVSSVTTRFFPYFRNEEKQHYGYFGFMMLFPLVGTILCGIIVYTLKDRIVQQYMLILLRFLKLRSLLFWKVFFHVLFLFF